MQLFFAKSSFKGGGRGDREGGYQSSRTCSAKPKRGFPLPPPAPRHRCALARWSRHMAKPTDGLSFLSPRLALAKQPPVGVEGDLYPPHDAFVREQEQTRPGWRTQDPPLSSRWSPGTRSSWKRNPTRWCVTLLQGSFSFRAAEVACGFKMGAKGNLTAVGSWRH